MGIENGQRPDGCAVSGQQGCDIDVFWLLLKRISRRCRVIDWQIDPIKALPVLNAISAGVLIPASRPNALTVCDLGNAPRSPPAAFSIVKRRGPSLPCRSRKPFTGNRDEPVTNCKRRDLVSTGQALTVCKRKARRASQSIPPSRRVATPLTSQNHWTTGSAEVKPR